MSNAARTPGLTGLLPRDPNRQVPILEHYLRHSEGPVSLRRPFITPFEDAGAPGPLPPAWGNIDRLSAVADWPMYVNGGDPSNPSYAPNGLGDCVWAGMGHAFTAMRVYAGYPEVHFTNGEIITGYESTGYDPSQVQPDGSNPTDQGTDPAAAMKYLSTTGLRDPHGRVHKLAAYAFFGDPRNTYLMAQVLETFGSVGIGFNCTQGFQDAFNNDVPCAYQPGDPVVGGHFVVLQRRASGGIGVLNEITWGGIQRVTRSYNWHQVTQAVAFASEDFIRASGTSIGGLDIEQLMADTADAE